MRRLTRILFLFLLPVPAAQAEDWNRFYAGIFGGYAAGTATYATSVNYRPSGPELGVYAGQGLSAGNAVFAIEAALAASAIDFGRFSFTGLPGKVPPLTTSIDAIATMRLQGGLSLGPVTPYVFAGVATAVVSQTRRAVGSPNVTTSVLSAGLTGGGGVKLDLPEGGHLRAEYGVTWLPSAGSSPMAVTLHQVRVGAGLPF